MRLTDDADLYFLYNLVISEEDFQRYADFVQKMFLHSFGFKAV